MITILSALVSLLSFRVRSRASLELEVVALRHQVAVLRRQRPGRLRLLCADRLLWVWLYRIWPRALHAMVLVKPATVVQWHRRGFRLYWQWLSRSRQIGRPKTNSEIRQLICQMSMANPIWGAPRIHGELLMLGIEVSQATVAKYMLRQRKPPSQTWRTFLDNHVKNLVSMDFFTVPTIRFQVLYVVLVLSHDRRRVVHFNVTAHPTAEWTAHQLREAFRFDQVPRYLLRDRDTIFGDSFREQVQDMQIEEVLSAPRSPWQRAYIERVMGSIRRECLDHMIVFGEASLRRTLSCYFSYYHQTRLP